MKKTTLENLTRETLEQLVRNQEAQINYLLDNQKKYSEQNFEEQNKFIKDLSDKIQSSIEDYTRIERKNKNYKKIIKELIK